MAQNITLLGASYPDVPAVVLPKTGGGDAKFVDVSDTTAAAADVASGKYFFTAAGVRTAGTGSGGGGSTNFTLLKEESLGTISTTSTTATDTGKSVTVKGINPYDVLVVMCSVDTKSNGGHAGTARLIWIKSDSDINTKTDFQIATSTWNARLSADGTKAVSRTATTQMGVYVNSCAISQGSTGDNGQAVLSLYMKYNSTTTGIINASYTCRVWGVHLYDLIGV